MINQSDLLVGSRCLSVCTTFFGPLNHLWSSVPAVGQFCLPLIQSRSLHFNIPTFTPSIVMLTRRRANLPPRH